VVGNDRSVVGGAVAHETDSRAERAKTRAGIMGDLVAVFDARVSIVKLTSSS
jgi:hypothetical protein